MRNDGISVVAIVIVLLLMSALGFVFSSLIITKQKSAHLPFRSAQAFYAAQAGIEYAIRYACDWENFDPNSSFSVTDSLETGSFSVTYDPVEQNITSTGTADTATRVITLASFPLYVAGGVITLDLDNPPDNQGNKKITVYISNNTGSTLYIFQTDIAKDLGGKLKEIKFDKTKVYDVETDIGSDHSNPTPIDFSEEPYYALPTGTISNEFTFKDKVAVDTYTVIYHYYFEGGSEADNYTGEVKFTIS